MNEVFIVTNGQWDEEYIVGIFSSPEKALSHIGKALQSGGYPIYIDETVNVTQWGIDDAKDLSDWSEKELMAEVHRLLNEAKERFFSDDDEEEE